MRFGIQSTKTGSYILKNTKCGHCHTSSPHRISVYGKYFILGIIPMFPTGKKVFAECGNCLKTSQKSEFSPSLLTAYKADNTKTRPPVWNFAGPILILLFIAYAGIQSGFSDNRELGYINNPEVGDIYYYKADSDYSTFKIVQMNNDTLMVVNNNYMTDKWSGLGDIDVDENYTDQLMFYSKGGLLSMHETGDITSIHRD